LHHLLNTLLHTSEVCGEGINCRLLTLWKLVLLSFFELFLEFFGSIELFLDFFFIECTSLLLNLKEVLIIRRGVARNVIFIVITKDRSF